MADWGGRFFRGGGGAKLDAPSMTYNAPTLPTSWCRSYQSHAWAHHRPTIAKPTRGAPGSLTSPCAPCNTWAFVGLLRPVSLDCPEAPLWGGGGGLEQSLRCCCSSGSRRRQSTSRHSQRSTKPLGWPTVPPSMAGRGTNTLRIHTAIIFSPESKQPMAECPAVRQERWGRGRG